MRVSLIFALLALLSTGLLPAAHAQQLRWRDLTTFGGNDQQSGQPDQIIGMVTDSVGNFYVAGTYTNGTNLGGLPWPMEGKMEGFVARFDAAGTFQWVRTITGPGDEGVRGLCLGRGGSCYITGDYEAGATADGGSTRQPTRGVLVESFDPLGNRTWFDTVFPFTSSTYTWNVAVDPAGACYLSGWTQESTSFGGLPFMVPPTSFGMLPFVVKYSPAHVPEWIVGSATSTDGDVLPAGLVADRRGCYVALQYSFVNGQILGIPVTPTGIAGYDNDGILVHLTARGQPEWGQTINNPGAGFEGTVILGAPYLRAGQVVISGYCDSTATFSGSPSVVLTSPRRKGLTFRAEYLASNGRLDTVQILARGLTNTGVGSHAAGQIIETPGGTFLAGRYRGTVAFGTNQLLSTTDAFFGAAVLARFNPDGTCSSVLPLLGGSGSALVGVHQLPTGGLRVAGMFNDSLTTGPLPTQYPVGANDLFIASIDVVTGAAEEATLADPDFAVWPNPASDELRIQGPPAANGQGRAVLRDVLGREIAYVSLTSASARLSVVNLPSGVYQLQAYWPGGRAMRRVVVVHP